MCPPSDFAWIEGKVGIRDQLVDAATIAGRDRNAGAAADMQQVFVDRERLRQPFEHGVGDRPDDERVGAARQDHDELVAPRPPRPHDAAASAGRRSPGAPGAGELLAVPSWPPNLFTDRWWWIGIEAAVAPQPHQHGDVLPIKFRQFAGEGLGIIASVEDEQRDWPVRGQALDKLPDLCRGDRVGVATGLDALHIQRRSPAVMGKVELCQPGIRPAGCDRLTRRLSRRRVIVGASWAGLRVVARPDAGVQSVDGLPIVQRIAGDQLPQRRSIYVAGGQCVIQAAPPTSMHWRQTQVGQRGHEPSHGDSVQQFKQGVGSLVEPLVHPRPELPEEIEGSRVDHGRPYRPEPARVPESRLPTLRG